MGWSSQLAAAFFPPWTPSTGFIIIVWPPGGRWRGLGWCASAPCFIQVGASPCLRRQIVPFLTGLPSNPGPIQPKGTPSLGSTGPNTPTRPLALGTLQPFFPHFNMVKSQIIVVHRGCFSYSADKNYGRRKLREKCYRKISTLKNSYGKVQVKSWEFC